MKSGSSFSESATLLNSKLMGSKENHKVETPEALRMWGANTQKWNLVHTPEEKFHHVLGKEKTRNKKPYTRGTEDVSLAFIFQQEGTLVKKSTFLKKILKNSHKWKQWY